MIAADQPAIFGNALIAGVSSIQEGNIKLGVDDDENALKNRQEFLQKLGIDMAHTTLVNITYATNNFAKYRVVDEDDKQDGMLASSQRYADALLTTHQNHALFLPIADCVGVILLDPTKKILMLSHIGRHSSEIEGAYKSVQFMQEHGANAKNIQVWLSPAVGKATYPLHAFNGQSLHEVITDQLLKAGVLQENIEASKVDTANDENYYSHSQYLKGNEAEPGRFAVVAMIK